MLIKLTNTLNSIVRRVLGVIKDGLNLWLPFEKSDILGEELVVGDNSSFDTSYGDWQQFRGVISWDSSIKAAKWTDNGSTGAPSGFTMSGGVIPISSGKVYRVKFKAKTDSSSSFDFDYIGESGTFSTVTNPNLTSDFQEYEFTFIAGSNNPRLYIGFGNSPIESGNSYWIDNVSIKEVTQIAPDKSGNSNGATLYTGKALSFDGGNHYVDLGVQSNPATNMTFACWLNPVVSASTSYQTIIDYGRFNAWLEDNDTLVIYTNTSGASVNYTISDLNNKWSRLVVSVSGTTTSVYIDGTLIAAKTTTALSDSASQSDIGRDGTTRFFEGKLSDLQIYDEAWSQADVTFDYNNPQHLVTDNSASSIALSNLKGYWHLSEGAGAINYDSSGEGNNGAISGATWVPRQATIPQLGLMDWVKSTPVSDEITLISDPNDPSKDILDNTVRLREHSFNLDGIGYAKVDDDDTLDFGTGAFSIDGWAKYTFINTNSSTGNAIYSNGNFISSNPNFAIATRTSGSTRDIRFYINGEDINFDITSQVSDGAWFYFAGTRDASGNFKLYINDLDAEVQLQTGNSGATVNTTLDRYIGRDKGANRYYKNLIDDIRLYKNKELSEDEVKQNYKAGLNQHKAGSAFSDDFSSDYGL